ncbi:MAG: transglutaminase-like domain-containing protein, partial [Tannerellaceae bacterium]|nr:transglutaminase-like domain-containing protein [Tannerellaceae bacterium]
TNQADKATVEKHFELKKSQLPNGNLFSIFNENLSIWEKDALMFLYAYMPIGDFTDYDGEFYLNNVRQTQKAKEVMPWGKDIPDDIFRHFVLPVRVNNENMDDSRMVMYAELEERVKNLSLYDAVLEVNHWCHEKVTYTPSDARTSSPLSSMKSAYGRCGEESTFTVAALRSVGIPARQVYTPRWAHTDDNHAWVEAWVDGTWYFLGACEPEPVLNMGWFNGPAYRGMLMHTKAFGYYEGPEEVMERTAAYTEINVTDNYAPTAKATILVVDENGTPVEDADVEFKIYNYASLYSVARKQTDKEGKAFLSAGKGDMIAWATKNGKIGFEKVSFGKDDVVTITLKERAAALKDTKMDIIPPVDGTIPVTVTEEQVAENAKRLQEENAIRSAYVETFYTEEKAKELAKELGTDTEQTVAVMIGSRGNYNTIESFLKNTPKELRPQALALLQTISAKDLRDTHEVGTLKDHLDNTRNKENSLYVPYIMNPRVSNELITPYKEFFQKELDASLATQATENPQRLVDWVKENIQINNELNPQLIPIMPKGVWKAKVADTHSRNIFFVAVARSLGIPARIESVTQKVQYNQNGTWFDVDFEADKQAGTKQGKVVAAYAPIKTLPDPKYYSHFTISKVLPDGKLQTLNFRASANVDMGLGNTWSGILKRPFVLDEGDYMLVTGTRLANGGVLNQSTFFTIEPDKTTSIELIMRENPDEIQVIGTLDAEALYQSADSRQETSILATTGRGYFIIGILGSRQEPTNHAMRDIAAFKSDFEDWGRSIILLFKDEQNLNNFDKNEFGSLPSTITYGIDRDHLITQMIANGMNLTNTNNLPIFVIADTFGRIVFISQGYTIGLGEQMMKVIHRL